MLKVTYNRNVDKMKKNSGDSIITWSFFILFQEVHSDKININPPANQLRSTLKNIGNTATGSAKSINIQKIDDEEENVQKIDQDEEENEEANETSEIPKRKKVVMKMKRKQSL